MRIKICRKEAKESRLWLRLTEPTHENEKERQELIYFKEKIINKRLFGH